MTADRGDGVSLLIGDVADAGELNREIKSRCETVMCASRCILPSLFFDEVFANFVLNKKQVFINFFPHFY